MTLTEPSDPRSPVPVDAFRAPGTPAPNPILKFLQPVSAGNIEAVLQNGTDTIGCRQALGILPGSIQYTASAAKTPMLISGLTKARSVAPR
jgi:hypothetical protein